MGRPTAIVVSAHKKCCRSLRSRRTRARAWRGPNSRPEAGGNVCNRPGHFTSSTGLHLIIIQTCGWKDSRMQTWIGFHSLVAVECTRQQALGQIDSTRTRRKTPNDADVISKPGKQLLEGAHDAHQAVHARCAAAGRCYLICCHTVCSRTQCQKCE